MFLNQRPALLPLFNMGKSVHGIASFSIRVHNLKCLSRSSKGKEKARSLSLTILSYEGIEMVEIETHALVWPQLSSKGAVWIPFFTALQLAVCRFLGNQRAFLLHGFLGLL